MTLRLWATFLNFTLTLGGLLGQSGDVGPPRPDTVAHEPGGDGHDQAKSLQFGVMEIKGAGG